MTATLMTDDQLFELVESIWNTMLGLAVTRDRNDDVAVESCLAASIHFGGAFQGTLRLLTSEQFARRATALMLAAPESFLTTFEVDDALGELCNILAGGVKNLVPGPSSLSLPGVLRGIHLVEVPRVELAGGLRFTCEEHPLEVQVLQRCHEGNGNRPRC